MALQCSGEGHEPPKNRVGLSIGAFTTRIVLGDLDDTALEETAIGVSYERRVSKQLTLQVSGGGIVVGHLYDQAVAFQGGFLGGAGSYVLVDQKGSIPFVMLGVSLSASAAGLANSSAILFAADIRGSVTCGYTDGRVTAYAVGRLFGGPIILADSGGTSLGTDRFHYQLGAGIVVSLPKSFDLSLELVPLGEKRISAGIGYSF